MAIDAYVGLPGHGKSYGVTEHVIIPSIKEGRHVVTNIPMEREELLADFGSPGSELTQLPEDWHEREDLADLIPPGSVVVLDELWRRWPSGLKANQAALSDKSLLAEHRHRVDDKGRSMRVVLVTQDLSQLAAWVRILIEQTYKMTKLTAVGSSKKFRVDIYQGAPTGQNIPKSKLIRQTYGSYKSEIYKYYQSATQSATGSVGDESKADGRGNIFKSGFMIFAIVAPIVITPFLLWHIYGLFFGSGMVEVEPAAAPHTVVVNRPPLPGQQAAVQFSPPEPKVIPPEPVEPPEPPVPGMSTTWRVAGFMFSGDGTGEPTKKDFIILQTSVGGSLRYMPATECERMSDNINWSCLVDGSIATAWTGMGGYTEWASSSSDLGSRTVRAASGATGADSSSYQNQAPQNPTL